MVTFPIKLSEGSNEYLFPIQLETYVKFLALNLLFRTIDILKKMIKINTLWISLPIFIEHLY